MTSFTELARDAQATQRFNRLNPNPNPKFGCVASQLFGDTPIVAVTDYLAALPQLIASHEKAPFSALGTDGFGRSDTRPQLRDFFEVDSKHIVLSALTELVEQGVADREMCAAGINKYGIDGDRAPELTARTRLA